MRFRFSAGATAMLIAGAIGIQAAGAQPVGVRHDNQQDRIGQGVRSGQVTPGEAYRLQRQQHSIHQQAARMRDRNGGYLNGHQRAVIQHRQDNASRHIYNAKHNGRQY